MNTCQNKLLNALPQSDLITIFKECELVQFFFGEVIYESDMNIQYIYFPLECVISLFNDDTEGKSSQIASIGNEGAVGTQICLNENLRHLTAITTQSGWAYQMPTLSFLAAMNKIERFRINLLKDAYIFNIKIYLKDSQKDSIKFENNRVNFRYSGELCVLENINFPLKQIKIKAA